MGILGVYTIAQIGFLGKGAKQGSRTWTTPPPCHPWRFTGFYPYIIPITMEMISRNPFLSEFLVLSAPHDGL